MSANSHSPEQHLKNLLRILNKENCCQTQQKLREVFGWGEQEAIIDGITMLSISYTKLSISLYDNLNYLQNQEAKKASLQTNDYDRWMKKIKKFSTHLQQTIEHAKDPDLLKILVAHNEEVSSDTIIKDINCTLHGVERINRSLSLLLREEEKSKGRPPLTELYEYIYEIASLYKNISGEPFTILRIKNTNEKGQKEEYSPITKSHLFACEALEIIHSMALDDGCHERYTDKNLYNACENAQKYLKQQEIPR
jgi:hypothetical protein